MLVPLFDCVAQEPVAVNPNQVACISPQEAEKTRIFLASREKPVIVSGGIDEVRNKLNGKKTVGMAGLANP